MQTVTDRFNQRAAGDMRPIGWRLRASFDRQFDDDVEFFTIEESSIEGGDMIAPNDSDVVPQWAKYAYEDYSDRLKMAEWTREAEEPSGIALSMADIELNDYDKMFAPGTDFILPWRPFILYAGFGNETPPQFLGVNEYMPDAIESERTAKFHLIDFLATLMNRDLSEAVMLENVGTDEVLDYLFQLVGLLPGQYELDFAFNRIKFVYIEQDTKLGTVIRQLMEAEQGRLYMDELGIIQFKNRQNYGDTPVYSFDKSNVINYVPSGQDEVINTVEVKSEVREVQALQKYWELSQPVQVNAGETVEIWANFDDPVTTVDTPVYVAPDETSIFSANTREDGEGSLYTQIDLIDTSQFAKSYKMTFENTGSQTAFIRVLELWCTPAKVVKNIYVLESDAASVLKYDPQVKTIDNNFIQNETDATSRALMLIEDYKEVGAILDFEAKGNTALQISDPTDINLDEHQGTYVISKIYNRILEGKYTQILRVRKRTFRTYFTIELSEIEGTDEIAP